MEAKVNFVLVGAFVLVLAAALIGGVLWLSSGKSYRKAYDSYRTYMDESVSGLSVNAPVKFRGVEVGRVREIALSPDDAEQVRLTLDIEQGVPIREDTVAVLRTQGLTGIAYLDLSGGSRDAPRVKARPGEGYPVIRAGPSLMVRLDAALTTLLANLNDATGNFNALLDEDNRRAFRRSVADLAVLSRTLAARSVAIDSGLADAARAMKNTAQLTGELSRLAERLQRSADSFDRMAEEVARAGASASGTLASARGDVQRFTAETLPEVQMLVADVREAAASLRRFGEQVEQNPAILLHGRPASKPGPGE